MKTLDEALAHHSSGSEDGDRDAFHALFLTPVIGLAYFRIPSRVMRLMNGSQALPCHMSVDLRCGDVRMPEHHLNRP